MSGNLNVDGALARDMRRREFLVKKDKVPCSIMTATCLIEGDLHKRGAFRIIDELNAAEGFIAVTNARMRTPHADEIQEADFLALRIAEIQWVKPIES